MFSLESPSRGDSSKYTQYTFTKYKEENHLQLSQICGYWTQEFETAVVNEPSMFEPLKIYCIKNVSCFEVISVQRL